MRLPGAVVATLLLMAPLAFAPYVEAAMVPSAVQAQKKQATKTGTKQKAKTKQATTKKSTAKKSTAKKSVPKGTAVKKAAPKPTLRPGWPVKGPTPLPGSILPHQRIIAYYGNPLSKRMGVLGEYQPNDMLRRLDREVAAWTRADTLTPAIPALHLIVTVAQGSAGKDGKWRTRMSDSLIERVYGWAQQRNALLFLDVQVAQSTLKQELPPLEKFLARPNVHLGIDPEFSMKRGHAPGKRIGTYDARDVNWAVDFLADIVDTYKLPPKVLVIHRFTRPMLTNTSKIDLDPRVQIVIHMDGWGAPSHKRASYDAYVASEPVQFTGFKLFYKNDLKKKGSRLMRPSESRCPRPYRGRS
ncbi:MAG: hypothetical protein IPF98_23705 [Gemmatimonadetes bacterium]|nr:hypothetical protein [Gemmatimonadota bacterium]